MGKEIISSKDLHLYYGKKEALKGIDLTFNQGELTAMIELFWLREVNVFTLLESYE